MVHFPRLLVILVFFHIDFHVICGIEELTHVETMYVDVHVFEYVEYVLQLGVHKFHRMGGLGLRRSE